VAIDLAGATSKGDIIVLVDDDQFGQFYFPDRVLRPFIERNGEYFGPPIDDAHAISELIRMQDEGAKFIAFGWPAFWWLKHYTGLSDYLKHNATIPLSNERLVLCRFNS
jgi:hypothetical protein